MSRYVTRRARQTFFSWIQPYPSASISPLETYKIHRSLATVKRLGSLLR